MNVSLRDVHQALVQLGRLRFGEMNIEEAVREIVHTTHAIFSVDGAGLCWPLVLSSLFSALSAGASEPVGTTGEACGACRGLSAVGSPRP